MNCPKCGHENPDGAIECMKCGIVFSKFTANHQTHSDNARPAEKICPWCMENINAGARKCPFCAEWLDARKPDDIDQSINLNYFFSGLFDFSFKQMITPGLIRTQYAFLLVLFTTFEVIGFFCPAEKKFLGLPWITIALFYGSFDGPPVV